MPTPSKHPLLTFEDLSKRWQMSADYLLNNRKKLRLPAIRITPGVRGALRFRIEDIEKYERKFRQ